jgi:hypothetical protein
LAVLATGGMLLQLGSCATLFAPGVLAVGEQILLSTLLGRLPLF